MCVCVCVCQEFVRTGVTDVTKRSRSAVHWSRTRAKFTASSCSSPTSSDDPRRTCVRNVDTPHRSRSITTSICVDFIRTAPLWSARTTNDFSSSPPASRRCCHLPNELLMVLMDQHTPGCATNQTEWVHLTEPVSF